METVYLTAGPGIQNELCCPGLGKGLILDADGTSKQVQKRFYEFVRSLSDAVDMPQIRMSAYNESVAGFAANDS